MSAIAPNASRNLQAGFEKTGIYPLNGDRFVDSVLKKMKSGQLSEIDNVFQEFLSELRKDAVKVTGQKRKRK
jgi:hypothetical protein